MGIRTYAWTIMCAVLLSSMSSATSEPDDKEKQRLSALPGHLKPLGSAGPFFNLFTMDGFPAPREFFNKYVIPSTPLVMKNAAKLYPAFVKWTDSFFLNHPASKRETIFVEARKKENRSEIGTTMTFKQFVETYNTTDMYMVHGVPEFLRSDVLLPPPLQCEPVAAAILDTVTWFSSGGTKSVLHNDDVDNINCLFRGKKTLIFLNPHDDEQIWRRIIDRPDGSYSSMDVDAVDYTKFPDLADVRYARVDMEAGDCLFIPYKWFHQVNSFGSNLAVNVWWSHRTEEFFDLTDDVCGDFTNRNTLANFTFPGMDGSYGEQEEVNEEHAKKFVKKYSENASDVPQDGDEEHSEDGEGDIVNGEYQKDVDEGELAGEEDKEEGNQEEDQAGESQRPYIEEEENSLTDRIFKAVMRVQKPVQLGGLKRYVMKKMPGHVQIWDDRCQEILINYYGMLDQNKDTMITQEDAELYYAADEHTRSQYEDVTAFFQQDLYEAMQVATFKKERELVQKLLDRGELDREQILTIYGSKLDMSRFQKAEL